MEGCLLTWFYIWRVYTDTHIHKAVAKAAMFLPFLIAELMLTEGKSQESVTAE